MVDGHLEAAEAFVRARAAPAGARLPSDATTDPARNCAALAVVRAGLQARSGALTAASQLGGLDEDALVRNVLLPPPAGDDAAAKALRRQFPDAAVPSAAPEGDALEGGAVAGGSDDDAARAAAVGPPATQGGVSLKAEPSGTAIELD